jgi:DNA-binding NarL/FixJ family response regulator
MRRRRMSGTRLRVVVGEDSFLVRRGIVEALSGGTKTEVVAAVADLDSLREAIEREEPDVVVTDIRMPPTKTDEGIVLAMELDKTHPEIGVVVLSEYATVTYAMQLFGGGSERRAYLIKDRIAEPEALADAIEAVALGTPMLDAQVVSLMVGSGGGTPDLLSTLSERERDVLALLAEGRSNADIARRLTLTKRGVERHINAIFAKLELDESASVNRRVVAALTYARSTGDALH